EAFVGRRIPARLDGHRLLDYVGRQRPLLAEPEEPVDAALLVRGDGGQRLRSWQPLVAGRLHLGERGAVDADARGEGRSAEPGARNHLGQALPEDLRGVATVHGDPKEKLTIPGVHWLLRFINGCSA